MNKKCADKVAHARDSRIEDIRALWEHYCSGEEEGHPELGHFHEYGLSFDYVEPGTFTDQEHGYFRYQLSYGGPSEEFRFYVDYDRKPYRVEFWYLDWFDGANRTLRGADLDLMLEIWEFFEECGTVEHVYQEAIAA